MSSKEKRKLIIDTDPGVDDALAFFLLKGSNEFDIKAITTVQGNSSLDIVSNNASFIKNLLVLDSEVYSGSSKPLKRDPLVSNVHGEYAFGEIQVDSNQKYSEGAVSKMVEIVNASPNQIEIIAIGPLTNIAKAIQASPEFEHNIKQLTIMGGAVRIPGNMGNNTAEFNFLCDPEAADIVLSSSINKTLIPLDVCNKVAMLESDFDAVKTMKIYDTLMKLVKPYIKLLEEVDDLSGAIMYDPVAAYYLLQPSAFITEDLSIKIILDNKSEYGKSAEVESGTKVKVALDVNRDAFVSDFLASLSDQNLFPS